ncbi:MAG: hypothetical protein OEY59_13605 [Deltaproteobacteria bacterium]|nr:hypothetical protein [Deltaproteobacteria bacterium]
MNILLMALIILLFGYAFWVNLKVEKEKKRNRILQSFVAGIIRSISDYKSTTDSIGDDDDLPTLNKKIPIPYGKVLECVDCEFEKDFWITPYEKWLQADRSLFDDSNYGNDGFNFVYLDFFDRQAKSWFSASNELMSEKERLYLRNDIEITENNVDELKGEIGMFKDLLKGELPIDMYTHSNIDEKLLLMFDHINPERINELKMNILSRMAS